VCVGPATITTDATKSNVDDIHDYFGTRGKDFILADDEVFYKAKKMAQKPAALKALECIQVVGGVTDVDIHVHHGNLLCASLNESSK